MAHLPSYKSFNFHEVEEIEQRVFCPTPAKSDKDLKKSPGSLDIQEESHQKHIHHENIHCSKWENIQHSIYNILHHKPKESSVIVHVNEKYSEQFTTIEDSSEDDIPHTLTQGKKKKQKTQTTISIPQENLEIEEGDRENHSWQCLICRCRCKS